MNLPKKYIEIIERHGISLREINPGSNEFAFPKRYALEALDALDENFLVCGGDVLKRGAPLLEYVYANWHFDQCSCDPPNRASKSKEYAREYIMKFSPIGGYEPLFVFVLSERPESD